MSNKGFLAVMLCRSSCVPIRLVWWLNQSFDFKVMFPDAEQMRSSLVMMARFSQV